MKYIWLATDISKYELPIAVANSASMLAHMINTSETTVRSLECKRRKGNISYAQKYTIFRISLGEDNE